MSLRRLFPLLSLAPAMAFSQTVGLTPGMVITKSIRLSPNERLTLPPGPPGNCLTIRGNDITVDFGDAYVRGEKDVYHNRENFNGTGLLIDGCKNVTIKGGHIQGFRFNIRVVNSQNVRIEGCDVSFSRAIRMMQDGRTMDTFLNLRDSNAWRNYGAGVWLEGCADCHVEKCYGTGALIGAVLLDTTGTTVTNNDFSFNGGWGIALSHSGDNVISWNLLDFVNRTWGGGWGGDSAALAVANDCDGNYFVGNSMTHGGDGFFLSNRNDIGPVNAQGFYEPQGGSDHNVIAYNDGSWSPNNAFEGTFSEGNIYIGNTSNASGFGYWLGFSSASMLIDNTINDNDRGGIAIEQGKGTKIEGNHMERNRPSAIHLWQSTEKARQPFPSSAIDISDNLIADSPRGLDLDGSTDVATKNNKVVRVPASDSGSSSRSVSGALAEFKQTPNWTKLQTILASRPADYKMYAERDVPKGAQWLQPADYTPKDYRGSLAAQRQAAPDLLELYLLEPGVKVSAPDWAVYEDTPDDPFLVRIRAKPDEGENGGEDKPIEVTLVSKDGARKQTVSAVLRTSQWKVSWFRWNGVSYDDQATWDRIWAGTPLRTETVTQIGGDWSGRSPADGVPADHFAMLATTTIKVPAGRYLFHCVSDDGVRVYVDDRTVINRWNHHGSTADNAPVALDDSPHRIRVEYCQEDGAAVLQLDWTRVP